MSDMQPCPHCGSQPWFTYCGEQDDRRYVKMELECCSVLTATMGYPHFDRMLREEMLNVLRDDLVAQWNKRFVPDEDEIVIEGWAYEWYHEFGDSKFHTPAWRKGIALHRPEESQTVRNVRPLVDKG